MSFEDRVRSTVSQSLDSLVQQLLAQASEEREIAVRAGMESALADAVAATLVRMTDA